MYLKQQMLFTLERQTSRMESLLKTVLFKGHRYIHINKSFSLLVSIVILAQYTFVKCL